MRILFSSYSYSSLVSSSYFFCGDIDVLFFSVDSMWFWRRADFSWIKEAIFSSRALCVWTWPSISLSFCSSFFKSLDSTMDKCSSSICSFYAVREVKNEHKYLNLTLLPLHDEAYLRELILQLRIILQNVLKTL